MLALLALTACFDDKNAGDTGDTGGTACMEYAAASVTVYVVDPDGNPIRPDGVTWREEGGAWQDGECVNEPDCTTWVAGWEVAGDVDVCVCHLDQCACTTVTVDMEPDGCHVEGQELTVEI
jgi:hypothetical protein